MNIGKYRNSLLKISVVGTGNILNALMGFTFVFALAKTLEIEAFGRYAMITSLLLLAARLTDFGTNSLFVANSIASPGKNVSRFLSAKILLFLASSALSVITLFIFKYEFSYLLIFIAGLFAYMVNFILFAFFQRSEDFTAIAVLNTAPAFIKAVSAVFLLTNLVTLDTFGAFCIFALSMFSSMLLLSRAAIDLKNTNLNDSTSASLIAESIPAGLSQFVTEGWSTLSNIFAKIVGNFTQVGIFSLADKISSIFTICALSVFTVLLPENARRKKEKKPYDFVQTTLISVFVVILAFLAILLVQVGFPLVFGNKFDQSLDVVDLLILSSAVTAIYYFMQNYFYVEQSPKFLLIIASLRLVTYVLLALALSPIFNLRGIALAHFLSSLVALLSTFVLIRNIETKAARLS